MTSWTCAQVAALLVGGCSAADQPVAVPVAAAPDPGVRIALLPPSREGDAALKLGRLEREGPCLYIDGADGVRTIPAFMTADTRWDGALIVGTKRFWPGDMVRLGGGEIDAKIADLAWVQRPDPSCSAPTYWITVSIDRS